MAPSLPTRFVDRPLQRQALKALLLERTATTPGTLVISAIYGLGGIGKSVLAAALAQDPEVQERFPDGILWVTLGQEPDILSLMSNWIQVLTQGERNYLPTSQAAASDYLRSLLINKRILLVVDDVWKTAHLEPFQVGSAECRVLVTTREAPIPGTQRYDLDVMEPEQALELLLRSQPQISQENRLLALALSQEVGYLPLALELAAAQVEDGFPWQDLLDDLRFEVARLESLEYPGYENQGNEETRRKLSLRASFNLSLKGLTPEQLSQFAWLGLLPDDVAIAQAVAATLWEITPRQAGNVLRLFKAKALLLAGFQQPDGRLTYRMHDLMHDTAKRLLTASKATSHPDELPGLELSLEAAQATFLNRYRAKTNEGQWHTLPDDGYIHAHLSWHLEQSNWNNELHQLLQEETSEGRNAWYEACAKLGHIDSFVMDIARAWRLAKAIYLENPSQSITLQCRYLLIKTSLNSLAQNIPVKLMIALVAKQKWTPIKGLSYALLVQDPKQRIAALEGLAPHLPQHLLHKVLTVVCTIQDESIRAEAIGKLSPHLPTALFDEALTVVCTIQDESIRAEVLSNLAPHVPEHLLNEILAAAQSIQDKDSYAFLLSNLVLRMPTVMGEALEAARATKGVSYSAYTLTKLAPHLPSVLDEALAAVWSVPSYKLGWALRSLAPYLPEYLLNKAFDYGIHESDYRQPRVFSALAPYLPETTFNTTSVQFLDELAPLLSEHSLRRALDIIRGIKSEYERAKGLVVLASRLPEVVAEALTAARHISDDYGSRSEIIGSLVPYLPEHLLEDSLAIARSIQPPYYRAKLLIVLASYFPKVLDEALMVVSSIQSDKHRTESLDELAPLLPESLLSKALSVVQKIQDKSAQEEALSKLTVHLPEPLFNEALAAARGVQNNWKRVEALLALRSRLPNVVDEAFAAVCAICSDEMRSNTLREVAPYLSEHLLHEALNVACDIQDEFHRARALVTIIPRLPTCLLDKAVAVARDLKGGKDERCQAWVLGELALRLPDLTDEALAAARRVQDEAERVQALLELAPIEALTVARNAQYNSGVWRLSFLIAYLPDNLLYEALAIARNMPNEDDWDKRCVSRLLLALLPCIPEIFDEALAVTRSIEDKSDRAEALVELALHVPEICNEALAAIPDIRSESTRTWRLGELIPHLPKPLLNEALAVAHGIEDSKERVHILGKLVPYLPQVFGEALDIVSTIQQDFMNERSSALRGLLTEQNLLVMNLDLWSKNLEITAQFDRSASLSIISVLAPAIIAHGKIEAISATLETIQQVCKQW